jgi:hypothetical protein
MSDQVENSTIEIINTSTRKKLFKMIQDDDDEYYSCHRNNDDDHDGRDIALEMLMTIESWETNGTNNVKDWSFDSMVGLNHIENTIVASSNVPLQTYHHCSTNHCVEEHHGHMKKS